MPHPYDKPSNSGIAGIRPKRSDWKKKVVRPLIDYGRRAKSPFDRTVTSSNNHKKRIIPGLDKKHKEFVQNWLESRSQ